MERRIVAGGLLLVGLVVVAGVVWTSVAPGSPAASESAPVQSAESVRAETPDRSRVADRPRPRPEAPLGVPAPQPSPPPVEGLRLDPARAHRAVDQAAAQFDEAYPSWAEGGDPARAEQVQAIAHDLYDAVGLLIDEVIDGERTLDSGGLRRELKGLQGDANAELIALLGSDGLTALADATGFGRQVLVGSEALLPPE